jgi:glycosyltransferase involved in cell wall biosynthesis
MSRAPRICYAGTYERNYPRNRLVIAALRAAGARVEEAHVPVFEQVRDKSGVGLLVVARLAARLALAYARLVPAVALRLLRCDALAVGYIGQGDMLVLGLLARAMGRTIIFNPLVTLTDTLVEDRGLVRVGSIRARALGAVDRLSLRLADVVLVDTAENGQFLIERFGVHQSKLRVVPAGAEERLFHPVEHSDHPPSYCNTRLDVLFVGTFIPLHGVETIVRAAALLDERNAPVTIELVGTGQTYQAMRELARRLGIAASTLTWTDWLPYDALGDRLRRADVALGVFDAGPKAARVIPNKVFQSLACGVATITRDAPALRCLLRDGEDALLVPPNDPAALADAIERLLSAWTEADLVTLLKVLERHTMDRAGVQRFATMRDALTALRG